jgi:TusA-related sulfurtransferase
MSLKQIILDVSELEAPYPLIKASGAIKDLKDDEKLIFKHRMFPRKLQDVLEKFECKSEIIKDEENYFEMKITRS